MTSSGLWPESHIYNEILTGASGPEFERWYKKPLRQHVRVVFSFPSVGRSDIWELQRQMALVNENDCDEADWTVVNINNILV